MQMAPLYERRTGPKKLAIGEDVASGDAVESWMLPGLKSYPAANVLVRSAGRAAALPGNEEDIAFATVTQLSRWIEGRQITSERLTEIYVSRMQRFDPKLRCVITLRPRITPSNRRGRRTRRIKPRQVIAGRCMGFRLA